MSGLAACSTVCPTNQTKSVYYRTTAPCQRLRLGRWKRLPVFSFQGEPGRDKLDRDEDKEQGRKFRRTTFDHDHWAAHRSSIRYYRHSRGLLTSRIVRGLSTPLLYVGIISLAVCAYETALAGHMLPELGGWDWPHLAVSGQVFSISTFALSLLLVFRTNSSYHRWLDARKMWGTVINRCRDIARQTTQWFPPEDEQLSAAVCRWVSAFPFTLMASLRADVELQPSLEQVLQPDELQHVLHQQHPGTAVLQAMGACVRASNAKDIEKLRIEESISILQDMMGGCERIFRTPIPLSYTRHTSRFLVCWLTLLPFSMADTMGWSTVPVACGMGFFLFGIEEIGVQIEEPFGIMALESFCENIGRNVAQAQAAAAAAQQLAAKQLPPAETAAAAATAPGVLPAVQQLVPAMAAVNRNTGNGGGGRVSGGYTLPRAPPAVSEVLLEEELFADRSLGAHSDDSDSSF